MHAFVIIIHTYISLQFAIWNVKICFWYQETYITYINVLILYLEPESFMRFSYYLSKEFSYWFKNHTTVLHFLLSYLCPYSVLVVNTAYIIHYYLTDCLFIWYFHQHNYMYSADEHLLKIEKWKENQIQVFGI